MRALVIGQGTSGRRHLEVLRQLGLFVDTVSRYSGKLKQNHQSISGAFGKSSYDYVVVANDTSMHEQAVEELIQLGFKGFLLVEKPLNVSEKINWDSFERVAIGFNVRFHAVVQSLRNWLNSNSSENEIHSVNFYYGNSPKNWRPLESHAHSYSRYRSRGGGVLRDFSHEIDLANWLFGFESMEYALTSQVANYFVDAEDYGKLVWKSPSRSTITIDLNALDQIPTRFVHVMGTKSSFHGNFITGKIKFDDDIELYVESRMEETYKKMHTSLLGDDFRILCQVDQAVQVDEIIRIAYELEERH